MKKKKNFYLKKNKITPKKLTLKAYICILKQDKKINKMKSKSVLSSWLFLRKELMK